jgi:hypothetical protein
VIGASIRQLNKLGGPLWPNRSVHDSSGVPQCTCLLLGKVGVRGLRNDRPHGSCWLLGTEKVTHGTVSQCIPLALSLVRAVTAPCINIAGCRPGSLELDGEKCFHRTIRCRGPTRHAVSPEQ